MSRLKDVIITDGRKQYLIAELAGINETRLSKIIMGRTMPNIDEMKALAKALKTTVKVLFGEKQTVKKGGQNEKPNSPKNRRAVSRTGQDGTLKTTA